MCIEANTSDGNMEATPIVSMEDGTGRVYVTLFIYQASLDEIMGKFCYLEVSNELGRFEYNFEFAPRPIPTQPPNPEKKDPGSNNGLGVGAIVGIVIGCVLVVVAIIILMCFLVRQEKCCFAKKSGPKNGIPEYMSTEQRDNEAQNQQLMATSGQYESRDEVDEEETAIVRSSSGNARPDASPNRALSYQQATGNRDSTYPVS